MLSTDIRTVIKESGHIYICKTCFVKLPEKDRRYSQRKADLPDEVSYGQSELPL